MDLEKQTQSSDPRAVEKETLGEKFHGLLNELNSDVDETLKQKIRVILEKTQSSTPEKISGMIALIQSAQKEARETGGQMDAMINALYTQVQSGEDIPTPGTPEFTKIIPGMEKFQGLAEKVTTTLKALQEQMSVFGSGTLKMLEGMFGKNNFLGKIFGILKNSPKAQMVYLQKTLTENSKTLEPNTEAEASRIVVGFRNQIKQAYAIETKTKQPHTYDFVQHVDWIISDLVVDADAQYKTSLTSGVLMAAGARALEEYEKSLPKPPSAPPPIIAASPAPASTPAASSAPATTPSIATPSIATPSTPA